MKPLLSNTLLLILTLQPIIVTVTSKCHVSWQVGCGQKSVSSNVTFYLLDDNDDTSNGGGASNSNNIESEYDAHVIFHWGPSPAIDVTSLSAQSYTTNNINTRLESHDYPTDGSYYTGYSVRFGSGSGIGCEGKTFEGYSLVTFDDEKRNCNFGPTLDALPELPTIQSTPPPSKRPTIRPTTISPSKRPTPQPIILTTPRPTTKNPTRRPTVPEPNIPLLVNQDDPPTSQPSSQQQQQLIVIPSKSSSCGDGICSTVEYDEFCEYDCKNIILQADLNVDAEEGNNNDYVDAHGTMFSISSNRHIIIQSIDIFSTMVGLYRAKVMTKAGDYEGYGASSSDDDDDSWNIVYNNYNSFKGPEEYTTLKLNNGNGVSIPQDTMASFYILPDESMIRCTEGTGMVGEVLTNDNVLEIYQGIELNEKGGAAMVLVEGDGIDDGDVRPLAFRGAINYSVVKYPPTAAPTTAAPTAGVTIIEDVGSERTLRPTTSNTRPTSPSPTTNPVSLLVTEPGTNSTPMTLAPVAVVPGVSASSTDDRPATPGSLTEYEVTYEMELTHSELLDSESERVWIDVTTETIHNEVVITTGIDSTLVAVEVELDDQNILEQVRMLMTDHEALRKLQQSPRIKIQFTCTILVPKEENDFDVDEVIRSAFLSPTRQNIYISSLQEAEDGSYFTSLERVIVQVVTEVPEAPLRIESPSDVTSGGDDYTMYYIIAASVGGTFILLFATGIAIYYAKQSKSSESVKVQSSTTATQDHHLLDKVGFEIDTNSAAVYHPASHIGHIESKEDVDDVSTLGDPYMGDAVNAVMDTDNTVGESMVSSQQGMYDFGVGRPTGMDASRVGGSTIHSGSHVRNGMIFGEDTTLEDIYLAPHGTSMGEEDQSSNFQRFIEVAPSGKLGIVLDNPHGDLPIVWAIKETSALNGKVRVGDLLLSVDGVDCRGMSTHRVSTFLSSRSQNPSRTLVLARGSERRSKMVGV